MNIPVEVSVMHSAIRQIHEINPDWGSRQVYGYILGCAIKGLNQHGIGKKDILKLVKETLKNEVLK